MHYRNRQGQRGEAMAAEFLQCRGLRILAKNYRIGHLEIDLLARDRQDLYLVEVKLVTTDQLSSPFEQLTEAKQRKLRRAMLCVMQQAQDRYRAFHIACVGIDARRNPPLIEWIPDAVTFDS